jgi:hypothetical protein
VKRSAKKWQKKLSFVLLLNSETFQADTKNMFLLNFERNW